MTPPGPPSDAAQPARRGRWHRLRPLVCFLLAQLLGLTLVCLFARARCTIGPMDVEVSLAPAWAGVTRVIVPPLGHLEASTHAAPLRIAVMPVAFHASSVDALLAQLKDVPSSLQRMGRDARQEIERLIARLLLVAFVGGCVGAFLLGQRRLRRVLLSGVTCLSTVGVLLAVTAASYRVEAFSQPRFTGILSEAPPLLAMLRRGVESLPEAREQLGHAARNLAEVYARLESSAPARMDSSRRVLHVSDLHNNPLGLDFAAALQRAYGTSVTLVSGDITDYGTPLENDLLGAWQRVPGPKLFIAGNHDSAGTMAAVAALPGAQVLTDGAPVEVAGLRIVGWNDPLARRPGFGDPAHRPEDLAQYQQMLDAWRQRGERADILMLHHYEPAAALAGAAPAILFGHDHRPRVELKAGSVLVDAGTTGAAGTRYLTAPTRPPFSAAILHFDATQPPQLLAVDLVQVRDPTGDFTVERTTVPRRAPSQP